MMLNIIHRFKGLLWLSVLLLLPACDSLYSQKPRPPVEAPVRAISAEAAYAAEIGDSLDIQVEGEKDLSGTYKVDDKGVMTLPLVGQIFVRGLTTERITDALINAYGQGYLVDPKIIVTHLAEPAHE